MDFIRRIAALGLCIGLTACANFNAAKEFSKQGTGLADALSAEYAFVTNSCADYLALEKRLRKDPVVSDDLCKAEKSAMAALTSATLTLFTDYNAAIGALADGTGYDFSKEFAGTATALKGLKSEGQPVLQAQAVDAALSLANLLAEIATNVIRSRELERVLAAGAGQWPKVLLATKTFFGPHSALTEQDRPLATAYRGALMTTKESFLDVDKRMQGFIDGCSFEAQKKALEEKKGILCEVVRPREIQAEVAVKVKAFEKRLSKDPSVASPAASAVHQAIDQWWEAHEKFRAEAFKPSSSTWDALKSLQQKTKALKAAIEKLD